MEKIKTGQPNTDALMQKLLSQSIDKIGLIVEGAAPLSDEELYEAVGGVERVNQVIALYEAEERGPSFFTLLRGLISTGAITDADVAGLAEASDDQLKAAKVVRIINATYKKIVDGSNVMGYMPEKRDDEGGVEEEQKQAA